MSGPSKDQVRAAVSALMAVAEALRAVRTIPSGVLYAQVMAHGLSLGDYEGIIRTLKGAGLVAEDGAHVLRWTGPALAVGP